MNTVRRLVLAAATAAGLIAVSAGPASAGIMLGNHTMPASLGRTPAMR